MRTFQLERKEDISGISGTGIVAEGVEFLDGTCVLSWLTKPNSIGIYHNIQELEEIHGHSGKTKILFLQLLRR